MRRLLLTGSLGVALLLAAGTARAEHPGYVDSSALVKLTSSQRIRVTLLRLPPTETFSP